MQVACPSQIPCWNPSCALGPGPSTLRAVAHGPRQVGPQPSSRAGPELCEELSEGPGALAYPPRQQWAARPAAHRAASALILEILELSTAVPSEAADPDLPAPLFKEEMRESLPFLPCLLSCLPHDHQHLALANRDLHLLGSVRNRPRGRMRQDEDLLQQKCLVWPGEKVMLCVICIKS